MGKKAGRTAFALAALAGAAVVILVAFRSISIEAAYPLERAGASFARRVARRVAGVWNGAAAAAENASLRRQAAALALNHEDVARIMEENATLRRNLGFAARTPVKRVAAEVLSIGGGAAGARLSARADKGSLDGVAPGAAVETPDGLVGRVESVTLHTCEILFLTDPSVRVSCRIDGEKPSLCVIRGRGEGTLEASHISAAAMLPPGSRVFTSGLGGVFPAGIPVGVYVPEGEPRAGALEATGGVAPYVDFESLELVFVRRQ